MELKIRFQLSNIHFDYSNYTINQFAEIKRICFLFVYLYVCRQTYFRHKKPRPKYRGYTSNICDGKFISACNRENYKLHFIVSRLNVFVYGFWFRLSFRSLLVRDFFCFYIHFSKILMKILESWKIYLKVLIKTLQTKHGNDNETRTFCGMKLKGRLTVFQSTFIILSTMAILRANKIANVNCQYDGLENYAIFFFFFKRRTVFFFFC